MKIAKGEKKLLKFAKLTSLFCKIRATCFTLWLWLYYGCFPHYLHKYTLFKIKSRSARNRTWDLPFFMSPLVCAVHYTTEPTPSRNINLHVFIE